MLKNLIKKSIIKIINSLGVSSKYIGTPKSLSLMEDWCKANNSFFSFVYDTKTIAQSPPIIVDAKVHKIIRNEYERIQIGAYVAILPKGRVWGRNGAVITRDDKLITDVSREFGAYGGVLGEKHSIFQQISLVPIKQIRGNVAVIASPGANNYHHWLYDNVARIHLIEKAGLLQEIDYFVFDYLGLPFQKEVLQLLCISEDKILNCHNNWQFHIEADHLIVPSLPSRLGVVSDWTINFIQKLFFEVKEVPIKKNRRFYISRKKAPSRRIIDEDILLAFLTSHGFEEYFAEDHTIKATAEAFQNAEFIIGVHGSGLSNLCFTLDGIKVIDIVSPNHIDPYYWAITKYKNGHYAYFFALGKVDIEQTDLVTKKVDEDLVVDLDQFILLFKKMTDLL